MMCVVLCSWLELGAIKPKQSERARAERKLGLLGCDVGQHTPQYTGGWVVAGNEIIFKEGQNAHVYYSHSGVVVYSLVCLGLFFHDHHLHTHYLPCVAGEYEVHENCVWDWGGVGNFGTTTPRTTLQKGDEAIKDQ